VGLAFQPMHTWPKKNRLIMPGLWRPSPCTLLVCIICFLWMGIKYIIYPFFYIKTLVVTLISNTPSFSWLFDHQNHLWCSKSFDLSLCSSKTYFKYYFYLKTLQNILKPFINLFINFKTHLNMLKNKKIKPNRTKFHIYFLRLH